MTLFEMEQTQQYARLARPTANHVVQDGGKLR
jgi:hypothetical protein